MKPPPHVSACCSSCGMVIGFLTASFLVIGCGDPSSTPPQSSPNEESSSGKENTSIDFFLGDTREQVHAALGSPQKSGTLFTGNKFDSYTQIGLAIKYRNNVVVEISGTHFDDGHFRGKILGLSLGDSAEDYSSIFGEPDTIFETESEYNVHTWKRAGFDLRLQIWKEDGDLMPWGAFVKGEIKRIKVSTEPY